MQSHISNIRKLRTCSLVMSPMSAVPHPPAELAAACGLLQPWHSLGHDPDAAIALRGYCWCNNCCLLSGEHCCSSKRLLSCKMTRVHSGKCNRVDFAAVSLTVVTPRLLCSGKYLFEKLQILTNMHCASSHQHFKSVDAGSQRQ